MHILSFQRPVLIIAVALFAVVIVAVDSSLTVVQQRGVQVTLAEMQPRSDSRGRLVGEHRRDRGGHLGEKSTTYGPKTSHAQVEGTLEFLHVFTAALAPTRRRWRARRSSRLIDDFDWLSRPHSVYPQSMAKSKDKKPKAKTNKTKLTVKEKHFYLKYWLGNLYRFLNFPHYSVKLKLFQDLVFDLSVNIL